MRTIAAIDADIAALDAKRRELSDERDEAIKARKHIMLYLWDDEGLSFNAIGRRVGLDSRVVKQFLWSRGRTVSGRQMMQAQMRADALND